MAAPHDATTPASSPEAGAVASTLREQYRAEALEVVAGPRNYDNADHLAATSALLLEVMSLNDRLSRAEAAGLRLAPMLAKVMTNPRVRKIVGG